MMLKSKLKLKIKLLRSVFDMIIYIILCIILLALNTLCTNHIIYDRFALKCALVSRIL